MTSPSEDADKRAAMNETLLSASSQKYMTDPLFFSRVQISISAVAHLCNRTNTALTNDHIAVATQAAAVALIMALVPDDELSESVDHGKVLVGMLDFQRAYDSMERRIADEKQSGVDDD